MSDTTLEKEDLARLAVGGRAMRRRRLNRALLARLIGDRYDAEDEDVLIRSSSRQEWEYL